MSLYTDLIEKGLSHEDALEIAQEHGEGDPDIEVTANFRIIIEGSVDFPAELSELETLVEEAERHIENTVLCYLPTEYDCYLSDYAVTVLIDGEDRSELVME